MNINNDILLSIKVNRVIPSNPADVFNFINRDDYERYTKLTDQIDNSLPESLTKQWKFLPQQINKSYLGESIDFFVLLTNDSIKEEVIQVECKVIIETSNDQFQVNELKSEKLDAKQSIHSIVKHELKHLGRHQIICSVSYRITNTNEVKTFKTTFQFAVEKPLDVKTKFYFGDDLIINDIYLEATLQNLSLLPISLEKVYLEPIKYFEVVDLNHVNRLNGKKCLVFGEINRFNYEDVRQYLFCLKVKKEYLNDLNTIGQVNNVGKLNIIWTSTSGIKGHLQTPQLSLNKRDYDDLQFSIKEVPEQTTVNQQFTIKLSCTNYSDKDMEPCLYFDNKDTATQSILWLGISGTRLPKLQPTQSINFEMIAYPVECGIQVVPLLRLEDVLNNNKVYQFKEKIYVNVSTC